ncbi:LLM class F420-dependent oxidoreductase [Prauserella marina]|uniref:Probable F420-dependent oxidoreductase, Rv2161c family n=2 Tax=Prauserella marina TaxID=530584 RepID=A0A222VR44_9PSEU|nr:LLM class F420-dependent oxidoreductase [Prauserella marina]ASR36312.1 LLM class F420-dependent oxidoreductase [Prauserella marina]PWV77092.1 putative F420-dependent oxidoreductase [Prauserella marina]SDD04230.1 probable F420-dependent oxidoreductase, Rv2161c family [Prauserella marina]
MRCGISTPIVTLAGRRPEWEHAAGLPEVSTVARTADRLGFEFLTCPDHVAVPPGLARGERFYDPLATFSYLAALTERIRFLPYVLVLPFYHPLELAKRYGTLDLLSGGRLTLGLGIGNLREEFDLLGVPFGDRGPRADDALRALRASLSGGVVSYHGPYYDFADLVIDPHAVQERVPLWIGGHSERALRRAITLADGWAPAPVQFRGPDATRLKDMLTRAEAPSGFDVVMSPQRPLDPMTEPEATCEAVHAAAEAGATVLNLSVRHRSLDHYLEQLTAFAELPAS